MARNLDLDYHSLIFTLVLIVTQDNLFAVPKPQNPNIFREVGLRIYKLIALKEHYRQLKFSKHNLNLLSIPQKLVLQPDTVLICSS